MKTKQSDFVEQVTFRMNADAVKAIQKSGQSAPDWFRQAARNRLESERNSANPPDAAEARMGRLEQEVVPLRKEIAKLQPSNAIAQAETRKVLVTIQHNQAELQRALIAMENGIGNTLAVLGPTLLAAIDQQIDQHAQAAKEERLRALVPPAPPSFENRLSLFWISKALSVRKNISQQNAAPYLDCPIFVYFEPLFARETRSLQATPQKKTRQAAGFCYL